jgi:hypothetical protein
VRSAQEAVRRERAKDGRRERGDGRQETGDGETGGGKRRC